MKKIVYSLTVFVMVVSFFSCKSTKDVGNNEELVYEASENKEVVTQEKVVEVKENDNSSKKNYMGWIDTPVKNPFYEDGIVKIKTDSSLGTFCIFTVDENGRGYPVFSTLNEYASTGFYLKAGKKVFKLFADKNIKTRAYELDNGVGLFYSIKNVADVNVEMKVFPSVKNEPSDTVKITGEIKNTGKKTESYALKSVLDTILGEKTSYHFYDFEENPISSETLYRNMKDCRWIISKNDNASMEIILDGGDITKPELVALANYATLEKSPWEPNMTSFRAFDTVLSYNNSAVGIIWPRVRLEPGESVKVTFYISLGLYGKTPKGYKYVYGIPSEEKKPQVVEKEKKSLEVPKKEPEPEVKVFTESKEDDLILSDDFNTVEFNVVKIPRDHINLEYVQSLMNRINELDQAASTKNPDEIVQMNSEILQLNEELDAILSILRQE